MAGTGDVQIQQEGRAIFVNTFAEVYILDKEYIRVKRSQENGSDGSLKRMLLI